MTDPNYEKLRDMLSTVQSRIQAVEVQVAIMAPAELLQFKGKVLEALHTIDDDLDKIARECQECHRIRDKHEEQHTKDMKEMGEKVQKIGTKVANVATKVKVYVGIAAAILTALFIYVLNNLPN